MDGLPSFPVYSTLYMQAQAILHRRMLRNRPPVDLSALTAIRDEIYFNLAAQRMDRIGAGQFLTLPELYQIDVNREKVEELFHRARVNYDALHSFARDRGGYNLPGDSDPEFRSAIRTLGGRFPASRKHYRRLLVAGRSLYTLLLRTEHALERGMARTRFVWRLHAYQI